MPYVLGMPGRALVCILWQLYIYWLLAVSLPLSQIQLYKE